MLALLTEDQMNASVEMAKDDKILPNSVEINPNHFVYDVIEPTQTKNSFLNTPSDVIDR